MRALAAALGSILVIGGCATVPGSTRADYSLRQDVAKMVLMIDRATGKECSAERRISNTEVLAESGGTVRERWTVDRCGRQVPYDVKFVPNPQGGTDFTIESSSGAKG